MGVGFDAVYSFYHSCLSRNLPGSIPLIRSPKGNAAEMVARKLDAKLRDHLLASQRSGTGSGGLFGTGMDGGGLQRPRESKFPLCRRVRDCDEQETRLYICYSDRLTVTFGSSRSPRHPRPQCRSCSDA